MRETRQRQVLLRVNRRHPARLQTQLEKPPTQQCDVIIKGLTIDIGERMKTSETFKSKYR